MSSSLPSPSEQQQKIRSLLLTPLQSGAQAYLISMEWLSAWFSFSGFKKVREPGAAPGPIDNSPLFVENRRVLKPGLIVRQDYELLGRAAWETLLSWYGGGPEVAVDLAPDPSTGRSVPIIPIGEAEVLFGDQKCAVQFGVGMTVSMLKTAACQAFSVAPGRYRVRLEGGEALREAATCGSVGISDGAILVLEGKPVPFPPAKKVGVQPLESPHAMIRPRISEAVSKGSVDPRLDRRGSFSVQSTRPCPQEGGVAGVCGLLNPGNSCYLNSALQCLFHITRLVEFFSDHGKSWRVEAGGGTHPFVAAFATLMLDYWSGNYTVVSPGDLQTVIAHRWGRFAFGHQEDSHEFLMFVIERIHAVLSRTEHQKVPRPVITGDGTNNEEIAKRTIELLQSSENSVIMEIFRGIQIAKVRCWKCSTVRTQFDPFLSLSLQLPSDEGKNQDELSYFVFAPYDPLKPRRQMKMQKLINDPQAIQKIGKMHGDENMAVLFAEVDRKGSVHWMDNLKMPSAKDSTIWVFEIPDRTKFYVGVKLEFPSGTLVNLPFVLGVSSVKASRDEVMEAVETLFSYLWDPNGRLDRRTIPEPVMKLREKWKSVGLASKQKGPRLHVNVKRPAFSSTFLTALRSGDNRARHKLHVGIVPAATGPGFHWNRLQPEMLELLLPGGVFSEVSLEQCLVEAAQESRLDQWNCPKCQSSVRAQRSVSIWSAPTVLILHLKRFQIVGPGVHRKIESNVIYPDELDLANFSRTGGRYQLIAVIDHIGCMNSGHYLGKVFFEHRKWYRCSDSAIAECPASTVHTPNAYVLFYERIDGDSTGTSP